MAGHELVVPDTCRNPVKEADPAFRRRHALRSGREGYAFPDLEVVSSGARTLLAWKRNQSLWGRVEFLDEGQVWTDSNEFRESCSDLVDRVIRRLASLGVEGTFLEEEWAAIQTGDKDEIEFCETAAGLGWDPYDLDDEGRENVIWLAELLDGPVLEEAIAALEPVTLKQSTLTIASAIDHAKSNSSVWIVSIAFFRKSCWDQIMLASIRGMQVTTRRDAFGGNWTWTAIRYPLMPPSQRRLVRIRNLLHE